MNDIEFVAICKKCKKELPVDVFDYSLEYCNDCQLEIQTEKLKGFSLLTLDTHILSIDIGLRHLGMSMSVLTEENVFKEVVWMDLVDITEFHCLPNCGLHHSKTICDRVEHMLAEYKQVFDKANIILIEQQPPTGLVAVEQMIFSRYRDKAVLISPVAVHKHFFIRQLDYEQRKEASVRIASRYISEKFLEKLGSYERMHDISDSILFTLYWLRKFQEYQEREKLLKKRQEAMEKYNYHVKMSLDDFFDQFRYIPSKMC